MKKNRIYNMFASFFALICIIFTTSCDNIFSKITSDVNSSTYTVIWKNGDGSNLLTSRVAAGNMPTYPSETPYKGSDRVSYVFTGEWEPTPAKITGDVTYYPIFEEVTDTTYDVIWQDASGSVLYTDEYKHGDIASYNNPKYDPNNEREIPQKANTTTEHYTFTGWLDEDTDKKPGIITKDTVFKPQYEKSTSYTVIWKYEGKDSSASYVSYFSSNETPVYLNPAHEDNNYIPSRTASTGVTYTFIGWDPDPSTTRITQNTVFNALYSTSANVYQVKFQKSSSDTTILYSYNTTYNSYASYPYANPVIGDGSDGTIQVFKQWSPDISTTKITSDTTFVAQYTQLNAYAITYKIGDNTISDFIPQGYSTIYQIDAYHPTPSKTMDYTVTNKKYVFYSWDKAFTTAKADTTYTALFGVDRISGLYKTESSSTSWSDAISNSLIRVDGHNLTKVLTTAAYNDKSVCIAINSGIGTISQNAFYQSGGRTPNLKISIPNTISRLTAKSFYTNVSCEVLIPKSVTVIDSDVFNKSITKIYYQGSSSDWSKITINDSKVNACSNISYTTSTSASNIPVFIDV